jgi:hypothetical protein
LVHVVSFYGIVFVCVLLFWLCVGNVVCGVLLW